MHVFVDPAHLTGWESWVWEYVILRNRGLVLAGTILILGSRKWNAAKTYVLTEWRLGRD